MIRRAFNLLIIALVLGCVVAPPRAAAQTQRTGDVVVVLPFENLSNKAEFNWIGASFADALTELLALNGLNVISTDERWGWRPFDFGDSLERLQKMQGTLAYQILYQRDKALPFSLNKILEQAQTVPPVAFQAYAKGIMTDDRE